MYRSPPRTPGVLPSCFGGALGSAPYLRPPVPLFGIRNVGVQIWRTRYQNTLPFLNLRVVSKSREVPQAERFVWIQQQGVHALAQNRLITRYAFSASLISSSSFSYGSRSGPSISTASTSSRYEGSASVMSSSDRNAAKSLSPGSIVVTFSSTPYVSLKARAPASPYS